MRALTVTALATVAALALASAPANAGGHWHGGGHWGGGFWGGPGVVFGLAGAALVAGVAADEYCVRYEPMYDNWGNYVGRRPVNVC